VCDLAHPRFEVDDTIYAKLFQTTETEIPTLLGELTLPTTWSPVRDSGKLKNEKAIRYFPV
jgi:hypothetical protein